MLILLKPKFLTMRSLITLSLIAALSYLSVNGQVTEEVIEEEIIEETIETVETVSSRESNERFPKYEKPDYVVEEVENSISPGSATGQTVYVPNVTAKFAAKEWVKQMKERKAKRKESKESKVYDLSDNEVKGIDLRIPVLSDELLDAYATFDEKGSGVQITTHYDLGDNSFITYGDEPAKYTTAEGMLKDFGEYLTRTVIEMEVSEEEKNLKNVEREQDKLVKENGQLHKAIEKNKEIIKKAEEAIIQAEKDIEDNVKEQKEKQVEVLQQQEVVDYVKSKLRKF